MSVHIISATEASRSFSTILNKVHYRGESYEIQRGKEIIAKITPVTHKKSTLKVSELNKFFEHIPHLEKDDSESFEKEVNEMRSQMKLENKAWD